jgi:predicted DNA-binding transcriptional regulator AlpA
MLPMDDQRPLDSYPIAGKFLRQVEVLAFLRVSRATFWRLTRKFPELRPTYITPRLPLWDRAALERWIENRRNPTAPESRAGAQS